MSELYNKEILRLTTKIPNQRRLDDPDKTAERTSRICGSRITLDVILGDNGIISDFGWTVKACALGQATAAIVGNNIVGLTPEALTDVMFQFKSMVKGGEEIDWQAYDGGKWAGLELLAPVHDHPGRHGSVLLPFQVLEKILL